MAFVSSRAFALALLIPACSSGDNDEAGATEPPVTTVGDTSSADTTGEPATSEPTTTGDAATTDDPATSVTSTTSTTSVTSTTSSTTEEPTTDPTDSSGSDDTGPICDPGMPNCVCDEGACLDGAVCQNNVCVAGMICADDQEPPADSEDIPVELGDISDDDDDFLAQAGVLSGATDVDWYHLHGADTFGHVAEPTLGITAGAQRSCMFLECDEGGVALTKISCPAGTDTVISPKLRPGCCGDASFTIKDIGCPGQDESMQMWVRLDKPPTDICSDYGLSIHF